MAMTWMGLIGRGTGGAAARGLIRGAAWLGLMLSASAGQALTVPAYWSNPSNCTSCHDAPSSYSPFFGSGPSAGLRSNLGSDALFKQYVNGYTSGGSSPTSLMQNLSLANATAIRPYMLQRLFGEITGPGLTSAVPSHDYAFASTLVGSGAQVVLTIQNHRTSAATIAFSGITTNSSNNFWYAESCPSSIAAGGTCNVTVHFDPVSMGAKTGQLVVTLDGFAQTVDLSGLGQARQFSVSPGSFNFSAMVGTTNTLLQSTITNSGNLSLTLGTLSLSGAGAADYAIDGSSTCTSGGAVAASGACVVAVRFSPSIAGARNATLNIPHNAPGNPSSVALNGTANPIPVPTISADAASLSFGDTQLGANTVRTVNVQNVGTANLNFSAFNRTGTGAADYTLGGTCSTTTPLAPSSSCTLIVTFAPSALGSRPGVLTIASDASNGAYVLSLTGQGIPVPAPLVSLSTLLLDFGNQTIDGLYQPRNVTLTNTGTANLSGIVLGLTGTGLSLVDANVCGGTLAPSASCVIQVRFVPTAQANYTGTLSVSSNAAGSPHQVAVQGRGVASAAPVLAWTPAVTTLSFGAQAVGGASAVQTATLTNQGPGGATITLVNAIGSDAANFSVTLSGCAVGGVLYEGDTCDVQVQFVPSGAGAKTATVQFASTGSPPTTVSLTGTGSGGPLADVSLSQSVLAFGTVRQGARSEPQAVVLSSSGSSSLHVTAASVTGPYALDAQGCPAMPFDLPVGASCTLMVSFEPTATGSSAGNLTITSNAVASSIDIVLGGQGEPAPKASSGGCSISSGESAFDPTLWALVLGAVGVLVYRRRQARLEARQSGRQSS